MNGVGGGNIFVSSPTSGGGGLTCCSSYYTKIPSQVIRVKWQDGGCKYIASRNSDGTIQWFTHPYFKETEVPIADSSTGEPQNLEIHFYAADKVEAYVTSEISLPRIKLDKSREVKARMVRCPNDKRPAGIEDITIYLRR